MFSGIRVVISLKYTEIIFNANLGKGTNNTTELWTFRTLLKLAYEDGIHDIQIYRDSSLVVKWMLGGSSSIIYIIETTSEASQGVFRTFQLLFYLP